MKKINLIKCFVIVLICSNINIIFGQDTNAMVTPENYIESINRSFSAFQDSINTGFLSFQTKQQQEFDNFKKKIERNWGKDRVIWSDSVNWVEYYADDNARSKVNFKEGNAQVEILIAPEEVGNKEVVNEKIGQVIRDLVTTKGKITGFKQGKDSLNELSDEPVLDKQLVDEAGKKVTAKNVDQFTEEVISKEKIKKHTIRGTDGKERVLISVSIPLAPDYLKVRAEKLLPIVSKYANKYGIEPELILGVIHIESYFNPKAISHANAIGLMQLVPSSGGRAAYKYVYGIDKKPDKRFLFKAENNINMGTAYIKLLMSGYFGKVVDSDSRRYCAIASYNTGIGNVCLAVSGNKIVKHSVAKINNMTADETYRFLADNLWYKEAREYIKKVNTKYLMYKKWVNTTSK